MPQQLLTGTVCVAVHSPDAVVTAFDTADTTARDQPRTLSGRPGTRFLVTGRHRRADISAAIDRGANGYG
ncbi:hypothetical protein M8I34_24585 [Streptomyces sp. MCA2]|uniref:hypothetical protein n=1 Tax=Streptomyces sp. MCA2 TaxID=2944805 RepID=UPI002022874A|nr:hypothetical protein [Streptomyces sp. MCA2]MCL7494552.1 hypothetical protein [Streptomyces sp. MCA2]